MLNEENRLLSGLLNSYVENNGWGHTEQNVEKVCKIINKDLKTARWLGLSCNTGQQILREILNMQ